jgi:hypothetical protein
MIVAANVAAVEVTWGHSSANSGNMSNSVCFLDYSVIVTATLTLDVLYRNSICTIWI